MNISIDIPSNCRHFEVNDVNALLSVHVEAKFLDHRPSSMAAAALICAADSLPRLSPIYPEDAESWCVGLSKVVNQIDIFFTW